MSDFNAKLYNFVEKFFDSIHYEVTHSTENYDYKSSVELRRYYHNLLKNRSFSLYIKDFYIERVLPLVNLVHSKTKILDAGCGLGTESLLFAILGGDVKGIDLSSARINVARKRIDYFESQYHKNLKIEFTVENIFKHHSKYDIIWVNEAISHINPVEKFLELCYKNLNLNGKIIIADANKFNPYIFLQSKKDQFRSGGVYTNVKIDDVSHSSKISYAVERIFTIPTIIKLLSKYFIVEQIDFLRLMPFLLYKIHPYYIKVLEKAVLRKIPIFNQFSGSYVVTAKKIK